MTDINRIISWWFSAVTLSRASVDTEFLSPACKNGVLTAGIRTNLHLEGKNKIAQETTGL